MSTFNTINFLPEVFRSEPNRRFLGATMDQLAVDAVNVPINGYIGRTFAPAYKVGENYVPEYNTQRKQYQLESSVVVTDNAKNVTFNAGYIDTLNAIRAQSGTTNNHQRLFSAPYYNYDGKFSYDKFVNYYNYYWMPNGPEAVQIYSDKVPYQDTFTVTRDSAENGYIFSGQGPHANTQLTLARGGVYQFKINQPGIKFWLQTDPGISGTKENLPTVTTRQVFGVINNGAETGTVQFNVPQITEQQFYLSMPIEQTVDSAVTFDYTKIQNRLLSEFLNEFPRGIDGVTNQLQGKTLVFINNAADATQWTTPDMPAGAVNISSIAPGDIIPKAERMYGWQVNLVSYGTDYILQLTPALPIGTLQKVFIASGITYSGNQFWVDKNYRFNEVPIITSNLDYLYYQDGNNPNFTGVIKLVDNQSTPVDVTNDILGKVGYTSPNGVIFTNGLKVQFDSNTVPSRYANNQYYVDNVGTAITLTAVDETVNPESYGQDIAAAPDYITINRGSLDLNPWTRYNRWFHRDALTATATYNKTDIDYGPGIAGRRPIVEFDANLKLHNFGTESLGQVDLISFGSSAQVIAEGGIYTILSVGSTDFTSFGAAANTVGTVFTATRDGTPSDGTGITTTDIFNQIEGQTTATFDGVPMVNDTLLIAANDYDITKEAIIYKIKIENINNQNYITLLEYKTAVKGNNIVVTGGTYEGKTFWFNGVDWEQAQEKTSVNQAPVFDIVDANGYSFSDATVYPGSTFAGSKLFGYSIPATGVNDILLGFPLEYQTFNNIGDIVFKNYYDSDTFTYTENSVTQTINCSSGYMVVAAGTDSANYTKVTNWVEGIEDSLQYQIFSKFYDESYVTVGSTDYAFIQIDVLPDSEASIPYIKVYLNNTLLTKNVDYQIIKYGVFSLIIFTQTPTKGDKIDALIFSQASVTATGYYDAPLNLDINPLNDNFLNNKITLGQVRTHYNTLIGNRVSNKPVQDSYLKTQGGTLIQNSSPMAYATTFLNDPEVNFINGITLARKEYTRFKNKFLSLCTSLPNLNYSDTVGGVDKVLLAISSSKNSTFPWYYSDMVPQGGDYTTVTYTVLNARQTNYEINSIFDNTKLSNRAVLVYVNGVQRVLGTDYIFSQSIPAITFLMTLAIDDVIEIRDYFNTDGCYIPETPTKLGLYPKYEPGIILDTTYQTPVNMIQGHDGAVTPVFNDFRDNFLIELEKRIYNNIKATYDSRLINLYDVLPGRFRKTDYTFGEYNNLLVPSFLQWTGANGLNYTENKYFDQNNPWTWNYTGSRDILDNSTLVGSWRALFEYWFDTDKPHIAPWEMLGFSDMPHWWIDRYGPAPYTNGNKVLWEDLEAGYIWNNGNPYTDTRFARAGLTTFIPVDQAGNLLEPSAVPMIGNLNKNGVSAAYLFAHQGPAEAAWRRSSEYPYAVQIALAMAKPARYFSNQLDISRFYVNPVTGYVSNVNNKKISPYLVKINGDTTTGSILRTSGYINWVSDYIRNLGIDPVTKLNEYFKNFGVQLAYKLGGFTDAKILNVLAEQSSPGSVNAGVIIPDSNYKIYLNKSGPVYSVVYSAVVIERTIAGYKVSGYDLNNPYFVVSPSVANSNSTPVVVDNISVNIYNDGTGTNVTVPYNTEFATLQQLSDFLISYERFLTKVGIVFPDYDNDLQQQRNFKLSVQELLYWSQQGWGDNSIIVLNPIAYSLTLISTYSVVDEITNTQNGSKILDQNFIPIKNNNLLVTRNFQENALNNLNTLTNRFVVTTADQKPICYAKLNLVQYEHVLIFDNVSDFGDIVYIPSLGTRQDRLKLTGYKTSGWSGGLSATGYVYSDPTVVAWISNTDYKTGDLVTFNNNYYAAKNNIVASATFDFAQWTQILESDIRTGLLPSFGHNAQKFINFYDLDKPPQEEDLQLLSAGLIGFNERPYLSDLGVSIPTQTKFYQGYIRQKGSLNAINALTTADFDKLQSTTSIYEEWAFKVGTYGDLNNNQFTEFALDQSVFRTDPVVVNFGNTYNAGNIVVQLSTANVYNASNLTTTAYSLYNNRNTDQYINDLPVAGYVNFEDVDTTIFKIQDANYTEILNLGTGSEIWTAKDVNNDWNVYRTGETGLLATSLTYTLDKYGQLTFDNNHNFEIGDLLILSNFKTEFGNFNNLYEIISISNSTSVIISLDKLNQKDFSYFVSNSPLVSSGIVYRLNSSKLTYLTELISKTPLEGWAQHDKVWVDSATSNGWGVYTYKQPWAANLSVRHTANTIQSGDAFGTAVRISSDQKFIYVGDPNGQEVQLFANVNSSFVTNVTVSNVNSGFGSSIDTQGNILVVGAPTAANVHIYRQNANGSVTKLQHLHSTNSADLFGTSVALSENRNWLYVGEPGTNTVYAYWTQNANVTTPHYTLVDIVTAGGVGAAFGTVVKTTADGSKLLVSAPNATNSVIFNGNVYYYSRTSNAFTLTQTISSQHKNKYAAFGSSLDIDSTGGNLFIGAPGSTQFGAQVGAVERYAYNSGSYTFNQVFGNPKNLLGAFGSAVKLSKDAKLLTVGGRGSPSEETTYFDDYDTLIDDGSTFFIDYITNSGAIYLFEPLINQTISGNIGVYNFTQDLESVVYPGDIFGASLDVTAQVIVAGSPGFTSNAGAAYTFINPTSASSWMLTREQQPKVDIESISRTFVYDKNTHNIISTVDYLDPAKGKILNAFDVDIDYKRINDPAIYNAGTSTINVDFHWGPNQVGKIWWDLDAISYVDYEQDALIYRLNHWGMPFPGSQVLVYQWVESLYPPSLYVVNGGSGTPLHADDSKYCTYGFVDQRGNVYLKYYFWVTNNNEIYTDKGKRNSTLSIAEGIKNPLGQGIAYNAVLRDDTVAVHNINTLLMGTNSVLHVEKSAADSGLVHNEYALVQEGNPGSQIPDSLLSKMVDSLAGLDRAGNQVPDPDLPASQAYGISIRPRQSMFMDRLSAWANYLDYVNNILKSYPVVQRRVLTLLNSSEAEPTDCDITVATADEVGYIDTTNLSAGYKVLVTSDSTQQGKWTVYTLNVSKQFVLTDTQSYKTNLYWNYIDWYDSTFDPTTTIDVTVNTQLDFGKLTLVADTHIKVLNAGNDNFLIYYIDNNLNKNIVGIGNGTIQISATIPNSAQKELRQIVLAIQTQILIADLADEFNILFFLMIKYILTEQKNLDWVFKTSFITGSQAIRKLSQFPNYIPDNQTYFEAYINEVKPFRTILREFIVDYIGNDYYNSDISDFDLVPYWDSTMGVYRSPSGEEGGDVYKQAQGVNSQWYENYKYKLVDIVVQNPGIGYISAPVISIVGGGGSGAVATCTVNGSGGLQTFTIVEPGSGYTSTPEVVINGTGEGAVAYAVIRNVFDTDGVGHNVVRSLSTTMKFDRISYTTSNTFVFWDGITSANIGEVLDTGIVIVKDNNLYQLANAYTINATVDFPVANVAHINANSFNLANDRITAYLGNINLSTVLDGLEYPGVYVDGNTFLSNEFDSTIASHYTDSLGISPNNIFIDGGKYYDTFNSHAPQELIPGRMYDSLDFEVYDTNNIAFRITEDMNQKSEFFRIAANNTTTLSANLRITDTDILVTDASILPMPSRILAKPGVIFIGGEKITYYRNYYYESKLAWTANTNITVDTLITYNSNLYLTTGNVYGSQFANIVANTKQVSANTLSQIRRAVDGTAPPSLNYIGKWQANVIVPDYSLLYYPTINNTYITTGNVYAAAFNDITGNLMSFDFTPGNSTSYMVHTSNDVEGVRVIDSSIIQAIPNSELTLSNIGASPVTYTATANVSYKLTFLTGNITANVGDFITQKAANLVVMSNMRVLGNVVSSNVVPVIFVSNLLYTGSNTVAKNDVIVSGLVTNTASILGSVNSAGEVTLPATTNVYVGNVWYAQGVGTPSDGVTLSSQTTIQAEFLLASPGFQP